MNAFQKIFPDQKRPLSRPKSAMTNIKNILYEKYKKKKRINFFIAENISKGKSTLSSQKYSNNSKSQNNIFDYDYQSLYQLYSIKNTERRVKDFFMLLNSLERGIMRSMVVEYCVYVQIC